MWKCLPTIKLSGERERERETKQISSGIHSKNYLNWKNRECTIKKRVRDRERDTTLKTIRKSRS